MGKLVAIGGGECGRPGTSYETEAIDKEIIALSGKRIPNYLLIALGSDDPNLYYTTMDKVYRNIWGCKTDEIKTSDLKTFSVIREKIEWADIIYVGGGNTLKLMNRFRRYGVDTLLKVAYSQNKVLCGLSAGAICWCDYGNSDSRKFYSKDKKLLKVKGLGFLHVLLCPHFDVQPYRKTSLKEMMKTTYKIPALALENGAAIEVIDNKFRIITSMEKSNGIKCFWKKGMFYEDSFEKGVFHELSDLYKIE